MFHPLSLLDILAGRKSRKGVAGEVLINGQRLPKNYKCTSGYVVQVCVYGDGGVAILYRSVYEDGGGAGVYGCVQDLWMPVVSFVLL